MIVAAGVAQPVRTAISRSRDSGRTAGSTSRSRNGRATTGFGDSDVAEAVAIQANGNILVVGDTQATPTVDSALVRFKPNGKLDKSFSGDGKATVDIGAGQADVSRDVAFQTRRKFVTTGLVGPNNDIFVARFRNNGDLDD